MRIAAVEGRLQPGSGQAGAQYTPSVCMGAPGELQMAQGCHRAVEGGGVWGVELDPAAVIAEMTCMNAFVGR